MPPVRRAVSFSNCVMLCICRSSLIHFAVRIVCRDIFAYEIITHEEECMYRRVKCDLNCGSVLFKRDMQEHCTKICPLRSVKCALGCGLTLRASDAKQHERSTCASRQVECPLRCGLKPKLGDLTQHVTRQCDRRRRECKVCGASIEQRQLAGHIGMQCRMRIVKCNHAALPKFTSRDGAPTDPETSDKTLSDGEESAGDSSIEDATTPPVKALRISLRGRHGDRASKDHEGAPKPSEARASRWGPHQSR